ncbi:MAG: PmoA family protein [Thermoguttaceae bacterium]
MCRLVAFLVLVPAAMALMAGDSPAAQLSAKRSPRGVTVTIDGQLFTEYLIRSGTKPILWPILGPTGKPMTRAYPMAEAPNERKDHVHQRSMWFTHGDVGGVSFWDEGPRSGMIQHRRFVTVQSGPQAVVETENDWLAPDGKRLCEDRRRLTFGAGGDARWIDFDITLKASDGPVRFGDTKEGTFGLRIAESMKVDAKLGGRILNSQGETDAKAWGRRAAWVDYSGPVDGQIVGIAVMNHPQSFRFPTYWHVRTYGLFAANPFGVKEFTGGKAEDGSYTLPAGQSISLYYRVVLHKGDAAEGRVAEAYRAYAATPK